MHRFALAPAAWLLCGWLAAAMPAAAEEPVGRGLTEANKERLSLDDGRTLTDWYNGSPVETTLTNSDEHGRLSVKFANRVDHTAGEKNYPIGWPRVGKDFKKTKLSDWTGWDLFECWIYVATSRDELPSTPIGLSFNFTGRKQGTNFTLKEVAKDRWVHIVIPIAKLERPDDVQRIQFHIAEANYQHGDRVDFFISGLCLTRYIDPVITELELQRRLIYAGQRDVIAGYRLTGRDRETALLELSLAAAGQSPLAAAQAAAQSQGEVVLPLPPKLAPGDYQVQLAVRSPAGKLLDRKSAPLRVIASPW